MKTVNGQRPLARGAGRDRRWQQCESAVCGQLALPVGVVTGGATCGEAPPSWIAQRVSQWMNSNETWRRRCTCSYAWLYRRSERTGTAPLARGGTIDLPWSCGQATCRHTTRIDTGAESTSHLPSVRLIDVNPVSSTAHPLGALGGVLWACPLVVTGYARTMYMCGSS